MSSFRSLFEADTTEQVDTVQEFSLPRFEVPDDDNQLFSFNFNQFGAPAEKNEANTSAKIDPQEVGQEIIRQAKEHAAQIEKKAYERGYAQGQQEGREAGEKSLAEIIQNFKAAVATLESRKQELFQEREQDFLRLLLVMGRKVIGTEISLKPEIIGEIVKSSYKYLTETEAVRLRLNPQAQEWLENHRDPWDEQLSWLNNVEMIADSHLPPGGLILETPTGDIDNTFETRWQAVSQVVEEAIHLARSSESEP
jgi:flagellar assembly protein FliH